MLPEKEMKWCTGRCPGDWAASFEPFLGNCLSKKPQIATWKCRGWNSLALGQIFQNQHKKFLHVVGILHKSQREHIRNIMPCDNFSVFLSNFRTILLSEYFGKVTVSLGSYLGNRLWEVKPVVHSPGLVIPPQQGVCNLGALATPVSHTAALCLGTHLPRVHLWNTLWWALFLKSSISLYVPCRRFITCTVQDQAFLLS